jgi:hypothetical protein
MISRKVLTAALMSLGAHAAMAGVTAEEAAKLRSELTPLGAEKAGNKEGTIPAWTGGYTTPIPGEKAANRRGDPFKSEKPLYSITARNMQQYADKLTDGTRAMLQKYPETFRVDVYQTHRTAAAPQAVYEATFKNATRGRLTEGVLTGALGGIPFPIPRSAEEVMWNHILRWQGDKWFFKGTQYQFTSDGRTVLTTDGAADQLSPYYGDARDQDDLAKHGDYWLLRLTNAGPPLRAGEQITARENLDPSRSQSWVYLTGQRRVRKLPNPCCETPTPATAGLMSFDEVMTWYGTLSRFDWKLIGKKEIIVPYNLNRMMQPKTDAEVLGKNFINPDHMRWELHRVWVIENTLRQGQRHPAAKGRYYCDEDTWACVLADRWDAKGQLWRAIWTATIVMPDWPGTITTGFGYTDLLSGTGYYANLFNATPLSGQWVRKESLRDSVFTPDAMAGEGVR